MKARQHKKILKAAIVRQKVTNLLMIMEDWINRKEGKGEFIDYSREYVRAHVLIQKQRNTKKIRFGKQFEKIIYG